MRYLITGNLDPFMTNWYDYENNYTEGMVVYDLNKCIYTVNGKDWKDIEEDHL